MRIVFRTDASRLIGTGHLVRCRTLAGVLARRGASVRFICRDHGENALRLLDGSGFHVSILPPTTTSAETSENPYAQWLGASETEDAQHTVSMLAGTTPDWLIVDHYALSAPWERIVRPHAKRLMAIDDLGRAHEADALFDQNFAADVEARYRGRATTGCRLMLGPRYALLQNEYGTVGETRDRTAAIRRIAVFFGGVDQENLTELALRALDDPNFKGMTVDVLLGPSSVHADAIAAFIPAHISVHVHRALPSLAEVLARADLAIGAGGGNTWERCCLGLPSILISVADNQAPASRALGAAGIVQYLGPSETVGAPALRRAVLGLIDDPARRQSMSEQSRLLVDGRGAQRVAEILMPSPVNALTLRPAAAADREFFFHIANDPMVRAQSFSSDRIPWDHHKTWFSEKMRDPRARMFVLDAEGLAVGLIRFELRDDHAVLNYALDDPARGRKWGGPLVELGLRALATDWSGAVHAAVKRVNTPSCRVFEKLGLRATPAGSADQVLFVLDAHELRARYGP